MKSQEEESDLLLVYMGEGDPNPEVVAEMRSAIAPIQCSQILPGTFRIDDRSADIEDRIRQLPDWEVGWEGNLKLLGI